MMFITWGMFNNFIDAKPTRHYTSRSIRAKTPLLGVERKRDFIDVVRVARGGSDCVRRKQAVMRPFTRLCFGAPVVRGGVVQSAAGAGIVVAEFFGEPAEARSACVPS